MNTATVLLGPVHYWYLCGVGAIVLAMVLRANVVVPAILASFVVALSFSGSLVGATISVFNASLVAAKELFNIFLVIALMTSLLHALRAAGSDVLMVRPFQKVMTTGTRAFFMLAAGTYVISLFFWPTPAVPLMAATLLPAAIAAGLPAMGAAVALAVAGQGMALSSDYVIRVAPGISARAAGVPELAAQVADKALVLSLVTGAVALGLGYWRIRGGIKPASPQHLAEWQQGVTLAEDRAAVAEKIGSFDKSSIAEGLAASEAADPAPHSPRWGTLLAVVTPLVFGLVVLVMVAPALFPGLPVLRGGDAAALVGGTAALMMILATFGTMGRQAMHTVADHLVEGLVFSFRAMGTVLPIAGFFFMGAADTSGAILGVAGKGPDLLFEVIQAWQHMIPAQPMVVAFGVLIVGMITGIDGSGFAGLPLTGALSGALAPASGLAPTTLAAVGQMGAVWTGGGTLVAWSSLIAVTGFARVPVLEAVRVLFVPVILGLVASTVVAVVIW